MVKLNISLQDVMSDPDLSITSSPFAPGKVIIKRASFKKGQVPPHLSGYLIRPGECAGLRGKEVYNGKRIPKTAVCVAHKHKK